MQKESMARVVVGRLRHIRNMIGFLGRQRFCPVCNRHSARFASAPPGIRPREDAECVWCRALERHRLAWLFLQRQTDLLSGGAHSVLHVAPEACFRRRLRNGIGPGYLTADLCASGVDLQMDITNIELPEGTFDVILCNHVLEHVPDDRKAMREFYRVLKPGGWAVLLVPVSGHERTIEDPTVTDPKERERLFGQYDHVRYYGLDYADRLRAAGFKVECVPPSNFLTRAEIEKMGITKWAEEIYYCAKPKSVPGKVG